MSLNDDELREQLERRTTSAPLSPVERSSIIESVHSRSQKRPGSLFGRLAIPLAAAATVLVFVVVVGFPQSPRSAAPSTTPGGSPTASSDVTPSPSGAPASPSSPVGLAVLSTDQRVALAGDSSKVGEVVVSDAEIRFEPSPTGLDTPGIPQQIGTVQFVVVMGESWPDTNWSVHA